MIGVGDIVSRNSYNNDIVFEVLSINGNKAILKGVDFRLYADSDIDDLVKEEKVNSDGDDRKIIEDNQKNLNLDRDEYFYLPGVVLHIDSDDDYLKRCMRFYDSMKVKAFGVNIEEKDIAEKLPGYLEKYKPDIVVITGHDAYIKKKEDVMNVDNYQNTKNFIDAVLEAREYEHSQDKLIIIAGACQSNYEELIKAGANFASSPKRVNIHALDPAIIASSVALSEKNKNIDLINMLAKTKYGSDGIGGIITSGVMYVGFPRWILI